MSLPYSFDQEMNFARNLTAENERILSKAKPIKDLVVKVLGVATEVNNYNKQVIHAHDNEIYLGGIIPQYEVGHESHLEITLSEVPCTSPKSSAIFPKKLKFTGNSIIKRGNWVYAGIFLGEKAKLNYLFSLDEYPQYKELVTVEKTGLSSKESYVWVPRGTGEEEEALYLEILNDVRGPGGQILRTDFSVNYDPKIHSL